MKIISFLIMVSLVGSCANDKNIGEDENDLKYSNLLIGKWKAVSLFLSDASTGVCHQDKPTKDITFEFDNELADDKVSYSFHGSAPVNSYFGKVSFISFDEKTKTGKITVNTLGGTKMAGSPEMMDCEQSFYSFLQESTGFQLFDEDQNRLIIGRLKNSSSPSRDGGTYLVFEKIK